MTNDMTKGAITPLLIRFTIPLVLGNLFQLTYNAADSIIVGKFVGEEALAAVGTSNPLMTLAILFINGMCLGAGILVSTAFGAGNTQLMEHQVSTTAIAGTVFSLAFSALCVILATPLLQLMQVPADILPIAVSYLRIVFAGLIFTFFYNFLAATMRALGDSKSALYFLMISSVLNIGGDLFFVQVLNWGSNGCALSTVVSEALCCVLCVLYIRWKVPILQLGRRWLVFDGKLLTKATFNMRTIPKMPKILGMTNADMIPVLVSGLIRRWAHDDKGSPCYAYCFDRDLPGDNYGAWHTADLLYAFGTLQNNWRPFTDTDREISRQMVAAFANFVKCGNPNCNALPRWKAGTAKVMRFGDPSRMAPFPDGRLIKETLHNKGPV